MLRLIGSGQMAVSLFFVLSGFILVYNYSPDDVRTRRGRRSFYAARVARIYPVYLLGIAAGAPRFIQLQWIAAHNWNDFASATAFTVVTSLLMLQSWVPRLAFLLDWPSWSVSAEIFFYALFPFLLPLLYRVWVRRHWMLSGVIVWIVGVVLVLSSRAYLVNLAVKGVIGQEVAWNAVIYSPILRLPEFLLGMIIGAAVTSGEVRIAFKTLNRLCWGVVVTIICILASPIQLPLVLSHTNLLAPLFAILVLTLAMGDNFFTKLLSLPSVVLLGEASYAMYVLHVPIHAWMRGTDLVAGTHLYKSVAWIPLYISTVVIVSVVVLRLIENPMRKYILRQMPCRPSRVAVPVADS